MRTRYMSITILARCIVNLSCAYDMTSSVADDCRIDRIHIGLPVSTALRPQRAAVWRASHNHNHNHNALPRKGVLGDALKQGWADRSRPRGGLLPRPPVGRGRRPSGRGRRPPPPPARGRKNSGRAPPRPSAASSAAAAALSKTSTALPFVCIF
jgi:hypothetical protein